MLAPPAAADLQVDPGARCATRSGLLRDHAVLRDAGRVGALHGSDGAVALPDRDLRLLQGLAFHVRHHALHQWRRWWWWRRWRRRRRGHGRGDRDGVVRRRRVEPRVGNRDRAGDLPRRARSSEDDQRIRLTAERKHSVIAGDGVEECVQIPGLASADTKPAPAGIVRVDFVPGVPASPATSLTVRLYATVPPGETVAGTPDASC
jgi:hypothetical protein